MVNCQQAQFTHDHNIHGSRYIYIYRGGGGMYECKRMPMKTKYALVETEINDYVNEYKKL
jgi:hypothetical protein